MADVAYRAGVKHYYFHLRRTSVVCFLEDMDTPFPYASVKGKVFPYSLPSVVPGADPGVQAVSPQVT